MISVVVFLPPAQSLIRVPGRKSRKKRRRRQQNGSEELEGERDEEGEDNFEEDEDGQRVRKPRPTENAKEPESESDSDLEDIDGVMERLPDDTSPLLDFARASQGILLLLVLKQHLKNLYGFSDR